ncbi:MAG: FAD-dependent thymidylate synthase [Bacteroidetes bacterium]|nr:FAD-dependent thymidylate synthase [Bacteroidota bacterium]
MRVTLIQHTPEPELTIASAARLCYSPISATEIRQRLSPTQAQKLLNRVITSGHHSVLEHASFSFAIDGLSRAASHQLVRHRLASYSQQSQRYVSLKAPEYVTPPSIAGRPELQASFDAAVLAAFRLYDELQAAGVPAEDARFVLPNACTTRLVMTMNFRELLHACSIRLCTHAQWEIRELFSLVREEVRGVAPFLAGHLRIKCETLGYCDETETCGIRPLKAEVMGE